MDGQREHANRLGDSVHQRIPTHQPVQVSPHGRQLGAQLDDLAALRQLGLLAELALDSKDVLPPGSHLTLQLKLVDRPQLIDLVDARAGVAPHPRHREGSEQRRPQRGNQTQPQQAGIVGSQGEHYRGRRDQHKSTDHQDPTAPAWQRMLVDHGHGAHSTGWRT